MTLKIAVAGKGGAGKSSLSALICRTLAAKGLSPILAVDADPNSCLPEKLGITVTQTIGDLREELRKHPDRKPAGISKSDWMEMGINNSISESPGIDMVVMGRQEGPDCYCYINNLLRQCLEQIGDQYKTVVIDNEAGLEHLSRRSNGRVDILLIIANPTVTGLRTTERIIHLVNSLDLNVGSTYIVLNRCETEPDPLLLRQFQETGIEIAGTVPSDNLIPEAEVNNESLINITKTSIAAQAVDKLLDNIIERR